MKFSNNGAFKSWEGSAFKPWKKPSTTFKKPSVSYIVSYRELLELIKEFPELDDFKNIKQLQQVLDKFAINKNPDGTLQLVRVK